MLKKVVQIFLKYKIWLLTIGLLNVIFGTMLWLVDARSFINLFPTMLLGSFLLYWGMGAIIYKKDQRKEEAINEILEHPEVLEGDRASNFSGDDKALIQKVGETLQDKNAIIRKQEESISDYVEYIESWAHEIKTPLALMTFVLDNRKEEISPIVYNRLEYARTSMQEDIERMLYYARLKSARSDYFFTKLSLEDICNEVIEEYDILLQEQKMKILTEIKDMSVLSDKKGLLFIIRQIISNAIKYKKQGENPSFIMFLADNDPMNDIRLTIRDNGIGVKPYDLPYIFEKGFTGEIGEQRKNSTGMGLYLVKQVADNLKIKIDVSKEYTNGLEISFVFPSV